MKIQIEIDVDQNLYSEEYMNGLVVAMLAKRIREAILIYNDEFKDPILDLKNVYQIS